jgi:hypothetical protein
MSQIFFFSYARGDRRDRGDRGDQDSYLDEFFKDLSTEVAAPTKFEAFDAEVSFRDTKDLPLMENWSTHIANALQSSAVLVCITSAKYFNSGFCGKEYYVFDQRRRQGRPAGAPPPPNILSIVWHPVKGGLPAFMRDTQLLPAGVSEDYLTKGLRYLMRFDRQKYERCVTGLAEAINKAEDRRPRVPPLAAIADFEEVPNQFAGGDWTDAADPAGWKRGPEVANFIFVAETNDDAPERLERHGDLPSEWRPYLPPEVTTIADYARLAKKKQFIFREIVVSGDLRRDLERAKGRLNLCVVVGSHKALLLDRFESVRVIESLWWDGTALLVPCDDPKLDEDALRRLLSAKFPMLAKLPREKNVVLPIRDSSNLTSVLEHLLCGMRTVIKGPEIDKREPKDEPPPSVDGSGGSGS